MARPKTTVTHQDHAVLAAAGQGSDHEDEDGLLARIGNEPVEQGGCPRPSFGGYGHSLYYQGAMAAIADQVGEYSQPRGDRERRPGRVRERLHCRIRIPGDRLAKAQEPHRRKPACQFRADGRAGEFRLDREAHHQQDQHGRHKKSL
jgi:hypothetical protein